MSDSLFSIKVFIKATFILLLVIMFAAIVRSSVFISQGNQQIQFKQLQTLTTLLVSQASMSASELILEEDQVRLRYLANRLSKDPLVSDVTIYDSKGVKIASSDKAKTVRESLGLDTPLSSAAIGKQQLIEPMYSKNVIIGYVRITFEKGKLTAFSDHHYRNSDRSMLLMILLSFISGVLLTLLIRSKK